jgi:hypothetical protein
MMSVDVGMHDDKLSVDGTFSLQNVEHRKAFEGVPADSTSSQMNFDLDQGVGIYRDHSLIGVAHFDAKVGR